MAVRGSPEFGRLAVALIVQDVAAAADFYRDVLGAEEIRRHFAHGEGEPPGPVALAADMRLAGAPFRVTLENPRWHEAPRPDWPRSPISAGAASVFFGLYVDDVDATYARALAAGARPHQRDGVPEDTY